MAKGKVRSERRDHAAIAIRYAREVCDGTLPSGRLLKLRCQAFLDELERDWEFMFDADRANRACRFIELLPVPDGKEDQRVKLRPWQSFITANIFGWVHRDTDLRRFTQAHVWVAAGNGKSFMGSAIGLYMAFGEGQRAAEVACAAASKKQAEIVFDSAKQMMQFDPRLCDLLGVEVWAHALVQQKTGSKFEPRSSEAKTLAGMRPYCVIVDELHVVDKEVYAFLTNRLAKRDQTLLLTISTAGYDAEGVGHTIFELSRRSIENPAEKPWVFSIIYQAESEEDLTDEDEWAKAHPNLDVTVRRNIVRSKALEAVDHSSLRVNFVTEQLNRWASSREAWLNMERWEACSDPGLRLEDFKGRQAFIGLDMSQRNDVTGKAYVFVDTDAEGRRSYRVFTRSYLPEAAVGRNPRYGGWVQDGHLMETEGEVIDFARVEAELVDDLRDFPGSEVCYDPQFMVQMAQNLTARGHVAIEVRPTRDNFNPAMKELEAAVLEGRLHHDGNPCTAWQMGNVTVRPNAAGVIYPAKQSGTQKIDVAYAIFTALHRAMRSEETSVWFSVE
jgi:phage terminase large subunit-like protein